MNEIPLCPHCVSGGEMVNVTCEADTCPVYLCHACNLLVRGEGHPEPTYDRFTEWRHGR
jgi:hypothetical protein